MILRIWLLSSLTTSFTMGDNHNTSIDVLKWVYHYVLIIQYSHISCIMCYASINSLVTTKELIKYWCLARKWSYTEQTLSYLLIKLTIIVFITYPFVDMFNIRLQMMHQCAYISSFLDKVPLNKYVECLYCEKNGSCRWYYRHTSPIYGRKLAYLFA